MNISIQIIGVADRPIDGPRAVFGPRGGTIGRRSDNTLVIPDQSRRVSRVHVMVSCQGGVYKVRDQGSFLPVYVNGHGVGFQRDMTVRPGDRVQIGPYTLLVSAVEDQVAVTPSRPAPVVSSRNDVASEQARAAEEALTFELLEQRLAAAKAAGLTLTRPETADAESPFDGSATQGVEPRRSAAAASQDPPGDTPASQDPATEGAKPGPVRDKIVPLAETARKLFNWRS